MSDEPETVETVTPSKYDEPLSKLVTIGLLVAGIIWGYYKLDEIGYISHSKLSEVHAKGWSIGEYKDCNSMNTKDEDVKPVLYCGPDTIMEGAKVFKVEFSGVLTYTDREKEGVVHYWKCKKNDGTDPSMSCDIQKSQ